MNLNELAREISKLEGKKVPVNIAQIKEVLRCFGKVLSDLAPEEAFYLLSKLIRSVL